MAAATLAVAAACSAGGPVIDAPRVAGFDAALLTDVFPADRIRSIDEPRFELVGDTELPHDVPVVAVVVDGAARAYPLGALAAREVVNDTFGDRPVLVTYSPLSNTAAAFDRRAAGRALTFGVSGKVYQSTSVLYDRETVSLWVPLLERATLGPLRSTVLEALPAPIVDLGEFAASYPDGQVLLSEDASATPYAGYDGRERPLDDLFDGNLDARRDAMARVVGVRRGEAARAYPFDELRRLGDVGVLHDELAGESFVVFWDAAARSALDAETIADARRVGSATVYEPSAGGRRLSFTTRGGRIVDRQTRSTWTMLGVADSGPLAGEALDPAGFHDAFWFAWSALVPATDVWGGP